jgi:hypothetical protein
VFGVNPVAGKARCRPEGGKAEIRLISALQGNGGHLVFSASAGRTYSINLSASTRCRPRALKQHKRVKKLIAQKEVQNETARFLEDEYRATIPSLPSQMVCSG